jgi:hypothetical protein
MKKKAIALIPFLARRRRRAQAQSGAKLGGPALLGIGAAVTAIVLRRRKRAAAGHDVPESDLQQARPAQTEAASQDADAAKGAAAESSRAGEDPLGASPEEAGSAPEGADYVTPDTSADDPLVREQTNAAAAEAAAIGGDAGVPVDPAIQPVEEQSGEDFESFTERDQELGAGRETTN